MQFRKTWFSIVEFIITLIVLSIISIIVIVLFSAYMSWVRDEQRVSDLNSFAHDLEKEYKNSRIPVGSNFKKLSYEKSFIAYQWIVTRDYLKKINLNADYIDPLEDRNYYITISADRKYFQLITFLENEIKNLWNNQQYFRDYDWYIFTTWYDLWFVVNDNFSISEIDLNLVNNSNSSIVFHDRIDRSNDTLSKSLWLVYQNGGVNCYKYFWEYRCDKVTNKGWSSVDENCKKEDIALGSQIWAGCNSTLWKWIEYTQGECYNYDDEEEFSKDCNLASHVVDSEYYSSFTVSNIWWKLYPYSARRTACRQGRRVPTDADFKQLEIFLNKWECREWASLWQCSQLWWYRNTSYPEIKKTVFYNLWLPLSWVYVPSLEIFQKRWKSAYLWSENANAYSINTSESWMMKYWLNKNHAMSIRCIK